MSIVKTIARWGNANALRIPNTMLEELGLHEASEVELSVEEGKLIVEPVREEPDSLEELLEGSSREAFRVPDDETWLDSEPVGREVW